jgi:hypothetical protein
MEAEFLKGRTPTNPDDGDARSARRNAWPRMDKDATIIRVGPGATAGTTPVRYAAPQLSSGGCQFLTVFELTDAAWWASQATPESNNREGFFARRSA